MFCVCDFKVLMLRINPLIAVSLKTWVPEDYCKCMCPLGTVYLMPPGWRLRWWLEPAIAACSYIYYYYYYYYYYFFPTSRGLLGPLTYSKTLENWHTHWNLRPLGPGRDWYTGVAQGLYSAPWNIEGHISYILARRRMKLGTHIDLIKPNNFRTACHRLRPTGSWLFRV